MNKFKSVLLLVSVTILIACKGKPNNIYTLIPQHKFL